MAELRRQGACLSGSFDMFIINSSPERIYGGDMKAVLSLATINQKLFSNEHHTVYLIFTPIPLYTGSEL